jgi:CRISPR-associated protein Csx10
VQIETRSLVRVGLNRHTETAQDRFLYTLDVLASGTGAAGHGEPLCFLGTWRGTEAQAGALRSLLAEYLWPADGEGYLLPVGTARARGLGRARLLLREHQPGVPLEERLEAFQPRGDDGRPSDPAHVYAALTLRAPALLLDECGLPGSLGADTLRAYNPTAPQGLEVLAAYSVVERETWSGWSSAWGLPKPLRAALAAGGVVALRAPSSRRDGLAAYLAELEADGLGENRGEGWGEVLACDPFHTAFDEGRVLGERS